MSAYQRSKYAAISSCSVTMKGVSPRVGASERERSAVRGAEVPVEPLHHACALVDERTRVPHAVALLWVEHELRLDSSFSQGGVEHLRLGGRCGEVLQAGREQH